MVVLLLYLNLSLIICESFCSILFILTVHSFVYVF